VQNIASVIPEIWMGHQKFKTGHVMLPCPFKGRFVIHRLGLASINLHNKFKISMFTHYKDTKDHEKCINWGGLGVKGPPTATYPFDRAHTTSYSTLIETKCLSLYHFQVIASYLPKVASLTNPTLRLVSP